MGCEGGRATQDQNEDSQVDRMLLKDDKTVSGVGLKAAGDAQFEEQFPPGLDVALKVRKPYTITKQRERWTEEEHEKFLEALKLYGRAWRRIEEHVGTKTAVQIRSHAQKFFSKVERESTNDELSSVKPIEIPPPRPKRKPMHPYPRKSASPLKAGGSITLNLSILELENQSPTSVLSTIGSEFPGTSDSSSHGGSLSPVSSAAGGKFGDLLFTEPSPSAEPCESPSVDYFPPISVSGDQGPMKSGFFPEETAIVQDGIIDESPSQTLMLFGKTVLVTGSNKPSLRTSETSKPLLSNQNEMREQNFALNFSPAVERTYDQLMIGTQDTALNYMHFSKDYSIPQEGEFGFTVPWWAFYGGLPFSWTGSNTGPVNTGLYGYKDLEVETEGQYFNATNRNEQKSELLKETSDKASLERQSALSEKPLKGFVPYKKRCVIEKDTHLSTLVSNQIEEKRVRLCL